MNFKPYVIIILTLAVIWGCETQDPLIREARTNIQIMQFEEALEAAEQAIAEDSSNALGYYYKASALGSIAEDLQPPSDRKPYYEEMRSSMDQARYYFEQQESQPSEYDNIDQIITSIWANEHNAGAQILMDDSVRQATDNPDETAIAHFQNATTAQPDSAITYIVLSSTQYNTGQVEDAIRTYETAMEKLDTPEFEDYDFLISLYFIQNRFEDARDLAMKARDEYPGEDTFVQYLADSYLQVGQTDEAIELIRGLIENDPDNPQYYFVLGTQLYQAAQDVLDDAVNVYEQIWRMQDQLRGLSESEREDIQARIDELRVEAEELEEEGMELSEIAIQELLKVTELDPENDSAYNVLGIIYQNQAATLFDKRNNTLDNELAQEYDSQARDNLREAMNYYERAAEINPEQTDYWQALFQVYTTLGMDEKAQEAMEKAGIE